MSPYATRIFPEPFLKISGNVFQPYFPVFHHGMGNAKRHIRIIRPFARLPSTTVIVLRNLFIHRKPIRIILQNVFTGHKFRTLSQSIPDSLAEEYAFQAFFITLEFIIF